MATSFPGAIDTTNLTNPATTDKTNSPSHAGLHANANDSIKAVETKLGTGISTPATSTLLFGTGAGTSAWQGLTSAQLAAVLSDETGTGSAVFATTPTLVTPKVDTINENTLNNGVTVGGVNLKAGVVTGSGAGLSAGSTPGTALAANSVDASKIKWSATGSSAGIWGEELGRSTLSSTAASLTVSFSARKYLQIRILEIQSGLSTANLRFNNDSSANYNWRFSVNGATDGSSGTSATLINAGGDTSQSALILIDVINLATSEKVVRFTREITGGSGAATLNNRVEGGGKWSNTSTQISRVDWLTTSNLFAAGSEMIVLGHD